MFKIQKFSVVALMMSALFSGSVLANTTTAPEQPSFNDEASYAVGVLLGSNVKEVIESQKGLIDYNHARLLTGVEDVLNGKVELASNQAVMQTLLTVQEKIQQAEQKKIAEIAQKAKEEGDNFRAEFAKKADVKQTKSGLLYRIENPGKGKKIKPTDIVTVNYTGKLPNGEVFDSSRGNPVSFQLSQVVPGWTEGLQLIKKGGKIELVLPPELAYGEQGSGKIVPNSTLYFEVEVVDVKKK